MTTGHDYRRAREAMVRGLIHRDITRDRRILDAFLAVPRHLFVAPEHRGAAYEDRALPLIEGQTISQPSMIALMLDALRCEPTQRILEVGGGCGYAAALLSELCREVHCVEIRGTLAEWSQRCLSETGRGNVRVHHADGRRGLPGLAPFDRILISAGTSEVPSALTDQLSEGGRITAPVDEGAGQVLQVGVRNAGSLAWQRSVPCLFVRLVDSENETPDCGLGCRGPRRIQRRES